MELRSVSCSKCHSEVYEEWKKTNHAKAYTTLVDRNRHFDPECLPCHTTRFGEPGGFNIESQEEELAHVQCESCHGSGAEHMAKDGAIPLKRFDKSVCLKCHTKERSSDFEKDYDDYLSRGTH